MSVAPSITNQPRSKRKLPGLAAWLLALPLAIGLAFQSERYWVSRSGPRGPQTPFAGTICLDEIVGTQALPDTSGIGISVVCPETLNMPEHIRFYSNLKARVTPFFANHAEYDVMLVTYRRAKESGFPLPSWQQAEEILLDEFKPNPASGDYDFRQIAIPIAADGSHPRRMSMFVANVAFYWIVLLVAAYIVRRLTHRRWRSAAAGFPIELVTEDQV